MLLSLFTLLYLISWKLFYFLVSFVIEFQIDSLLVLCASSHGVFLSPSLPLSIPCSNQARTQSDQWGKLICNFPGWLPLSSLSLFSLSVCIPHSSMAQEWWIIFYQSLAPKSLTMCDWSVMQRNNWRSIAHQFLGCIVVLLQLWTFVLPLNTQSLFSLLHTHTPNTKPFAR